MFLVLDNRPVSESVRESLQAIHRVKVCNVHLISGTEILLQVAYELVI